MPLLTVAHPCGDLVRRISPDETRKQQKLRDLCAYLPHMKQRQYDRLFECQYKDAGNYHVDVIHDRPDHARSNRAFGDEHVICKQRDPQSAVPICRSHKVRESLPLETATLFKNIIRLWEREQEMRQKHLVLARRVVSLETLVKTLTANQPADTEEDLDGSHTPGPEVQGGSNFEDEDNDVREELTDNLPAEAPDATSDARVQADSVDITNGDNDVPEAAPAATNDAQVQADSVDITNGDNDVPEAAPAATGEGAMLSDNWRAQSYEPEAKVSGSLLPGLVITTSSPLSHRQSVSYSLAGVSTRKPAPDIVISDDEVEDPPKLSIQTQPLVKPTRNRISVISPPPHREVIVISDDSEDEDEVPLHRKHRFVSAGPSARKLSSTYALYFSPYLEVLFIGKPTLPSHPGCCVTNKPSETVNRCPGNLAWFGNKEGLSVEFHVSRIARPRNDQVLERWSKRRCMRMTTATSRDDEWDPRFTTVKITKGQAELLRSKFPQYEAEYRRLNPSLRMWKEMSSAARHTLRSLSERLVDECMEHERFGGGLKLERSTSQKDWQKCFRNMFKNFGDNLKNTHVQDSITIRTDSGTDEGIHKLGKMLKLSGTITGRQWFELSKKEELRKGVKAKKWEAEWKGHPFNPAAEYQNILKRRWDALSPKDMKGWDDGAKEVKQDVDVNRLDLPTSLPDFIDALTSERVAGPALAHIFVAYRDNEGLSKVISYGNTLEGKRFSDMWTHHEQGKSVQEQHSSWLDRLAKQTHQLLPVTHEEPDCVPDNDTIDSSPAVSPPALTDTPVRVISRRPNSLTSASQESGKALAVEEPTPSSSSKDQVPVFVPPAHNSPDATIPNDDEDSSQPEQTRSSPVLEARHGNQSPPSQLNLIDVADVPSPLTDNSELQSELRVLLANVMMEPEAGDEEMASDHEEVDSDLEEGGRDHKEGGRDRGQDEAKGRGKGTRKTRKRKSKAKRTAVKVGKTVESTGGTSLSTAMTVTKGRNGRQGAKAQERNKTPPPKAKNWKWQSPGAPKPLLDQAPDTTLPRTRLGNKRKTEDRVDAAAAPSRKKARRS
ncbi:hypothetical protein IW261DRAFT_1421800 [Armillaria novae-zelandiae]|uniref:Uncharacterized protein n=1 Tax=Armillaria novae-zelandiae TaxID=153914 RepID=A0AA39P2T4_9AGAR|nr:hypothetical protein IW261DRAFT_1421800 [Armillaria novae-zelandiae]